MGKASAPRPTPEDGRDCIRGAICGPCGWLDVVIIITCALLMHVRLPRERDTAETSNGRETTISVHRSYCRDLDTTQNEHSSRGLPSFMLFFFSPRWDRFLERSACT